MFRDCNNSAVPMRARPTRPVRASQCAVLAETPLRAPCCSLTMCRRPIPLAAGSAGPVMMRSTLPASACARAADRWRQGRAQCPAWSNLIVRRTAKKLVLVLPMAAATQLTPRRGWQPGSALAPSPSAAAICVAMASSRSWLDSAEVPTGVPLMNRRALRCGLLLQFPHRPTCRPICVPSPIGAIAVSISATTAMAGWMPVCGLLTATVIGNGRRPAISSCVNLRRNLARSPQIATA